MIARPVSSNPDIIWHSTEFVDVVWRPLTGISANILAAIYVVGLAILTGIVLVHAFGWGVGLALLGLSFVALLTGLAIASNEKLKTFRRAAHDAATDEAVVLLVHGRLHDAMKSSGRHVETAREVTEALLESGFRDLTLRIDSKQAVLPIQPDLAPFEPRLLNEAEDSLESQALTNGETQARMRAGRLPIFRTIQRHLTLGGGLIVLIALAPSLPMLAHAARSGRLRDLAPGVAMALLVIVVFSLRAWRSRQKQPFAVAGGLVLRSFTRGASHATLRRLDRRNSVLTACRGYGTRQWAVSVGDEQGSELLVMTAAEVDALLRAWLSPLPTPTLEQTSDFH